MADFANVNVRVADKTQQLKMEKGVVFENKGGKYTIDANGQLMKFDKKSNVWVQAKQIEMTNYQWEAFQNVSDNDGQVGTYSKKDIQLAQAKYKAGGFVADMKQDLPAGYRIESPRLNSAESSVEVKVTNGKESQSATLKFQIAEMADLKAASEAYQADKAQGAQQTGKTQNAGQPQKATQSKFVRPKEVSSKDLEMLEEMGLVVGNKIDPSERVDYISSLEHSPSGTLFEGLENKEVTPDLIDKMVNELLTSGSGFFRSGDFGKLARLAKYLKPETLDKFLLVDDSDSIGNDIRAFCSAADMKILYDRLSPQQQVKYYKMVLSMGMNTTDGSNQISGKSTAAYLFLDKFSGENYNTLKNFIKKMDDPYYRIKSTRTQCKVLIDTLLEQGKITQAQANELYAAGNIKR